MRRLQRIIFNGVTVLSLVLWVATAGLWVRSYYTSDCSRRYLPTRGYEICSDSGEIAITMIRAKVLDSEWGWEFSDRAVFNLAVGLNGKVDRSWNLCAIRVVKGQLATTDGAWHVLIFHHWHMLLATTIAPAFTAVAYLRRRKSRGTEENLCPACDYDLRATPERCPECGRLPN